MRRLSLTEFVFRHPLQFDEVFLSKWLFCEVTCEQKKKKLF